MKDVLCSDFVAIRKLCSKVTFEPVERNAFHDLKMFELAQKIFTLNEIA